uniref:Haloacid dehalogenase-like hydrolase domain-containing protein 3-like n=1 Tax=Tetraselmis sp. GSL018 TaxID=582737 RepID=A0A061QZ03_9CHLO|mmetsp:Transcript_11098/g.26328  ORF Transcript_11098/g.26328 Transcript_11098/m.26328 type:complete len:293 (-) Transcript_11098:130-1008(-)
MSNLPLLSVARLAKQATFGWLPLATLQSRSGRQFAGGTPLPLPLSTVKQPKHMNSLAAFAEAGPPESNRQTFVKALLLDVAGTLLNPTEPVTEVYRRYDRNHVITATDAEMLRRFRSAYNRPWGRSTIRYVGDGREFWKYVVTETTGCNDNEFFEGIYEYYARKEAWRVTSGAIECLRELKEKGVKIALVSNFDTRLRRILEDMQLTSLFDAVIVSAEVSAEKPNPVIFTAAVETLGLSPEECVHVGDDRRNDLWGARDAGCHALLWGYDVQDMAQVKQWVEHGCVEDDDTC